MVMVEFESISLLLESYVLTLKAPEVLADGGLLIPLVIINCTKFGAFSPKGNAFSIVIVLVLT